MLNKIVVMTIIALLSVVEVSAAVATPNIIVIDNTRGTVVDSFNLTIYNRTGGYYSSYQTNGSVTNLYNPIGNSTTSSSYNLLGYFSFENSTLITTSINYDASCAPSAGYGCYFMVNMTYHDDTIYTSPEETLTSVSSATYSLTDYNTTKPIKQISYYAKRSGSGVTPTISSTTFYGIHNNSIAKPTLTDDNYTVYLNTTNYLVANFSVNITNNTAYYLSTYQTNSLILSVKNENTQSFITSTNASIELRGSYIGYNYSTVAGLVNASLVIPDTYVVTISASGYSTRSYLFTVANNTIATRTFYLLPNGYNTLVVTDVDKSYQSLSGYQNSLVRLNSSGSNSFEVERCTGDINGQCLMSAYLCLTNDSTCPYYQVIVYNSDNQSVGNTNTMRLKDDSLILIINQNNPISQVSQYFDVQYSLTPFNTTGGVTYTLDNTANIVANTRLEITRRIGASNTVLESITGTGSGSIVITSSNTNMSLGDEFIAKAYYTTNDGKEYLISSVSAVDSTSGIGSSRNGAIVFVGLGIMLAPLLLFGFNPPLAIGSSLAMAFIANTIGITSFTTNAIGGLAVLGAIILWLVFK